MPRPVVMMVNTNRSCLVMVPRTSNLSVGASRIHKPSRPLACARILSTLQLLSKSQRSDLRRLLDIYFAKPSQQPYAMVLTKFLASFLVALALAFSLTNAEVAQPAKQKKTTSTTSHSTNYYSNSRPTTHYAMSHISSNYTRYAPSHTTSSYLPTSTSTSSEPSCPSGESYELCQFSLTIQMA